MDIFTIAIWIGTIVFLLISLIKDKEKTKSAQNGTWHGKG